MAYLIQYIPLELEKTRISCILYVTDALLSSFGGNTIAMYGSSYEVGWGDWHLYNTYIEVVPYTDEQGCMVCAPYGCDAACSQTLKTPAWGSCADPGTCECVSMYCISVWSIRVGYRFTLLKQYLYVLIIVKSSFRHINVDAFM